MLYWWSATIFAAVEQLALAEFEVDLLHLKLALLDLALRQENESEAHQLRFLYQIAEVVVMTLPSSCCSYHMSCQGLSLANSMFDL